MSQASQDMRVTDAQTGKEIVIKAGFTIRRTVNVKQEEVWGVKRREEKDRDICQRCLIFRE